MNITPQEFSAVQVALNRAAHDYHVLEMKASAASDSAAERSNGQFSLICRNLADRLKTTGRFQVDTLEAEIVVAALRHTAKVQLDLSERERNAFERRKREQFAGAFAALGDSIAKAIPRPH